MTTWKKIVCVLAALGAAFALAGMRGPSLAQDTTEKPTTVLIVDSSRSMWGQIDGQNKVVIARRTVSRAAGEFSDRTQLGLVSYGHRQSSGCKDIELLLDPAERDADEVEKALNAIKPKGSTPIAESLVIAARAARYKERRASLILISDGLDNCNADPCKTSADLKAAAKDLSVHVIAFDAKNSDKLTALGCIADNGGGTFLSARSESELNDGLMQAFKAAATVRRPAVAQLQVANAARAMGPTAPDAAQRSDPMTTSAVAQAPQAQAAPNAPPPISAPAATQPAPAGDRGVPVTMSARTVEGGAIIKSGLTWWVYRNQKTSDGKYQLVETFREGTPTAMLAPGAYRIAAAYGKVHLIKDIDVRPGQAIQETFVLNAGGLRLNAVTMNGTTIPPNSVRYDIYADESESDQFGNRKVVLNDAKPGVVLRLNAGAYQIVSTYGDANAIVRADVTVEPGRLTDATINHSAAQVTFKLVTQPGGEALADTRWNILTPGGDKVKESAGALPMHILAAGDYKVEAEHKGKKYSREFFTESGEVKQIEVVVQ